jgi:hypothetical protein
MIDADPEGLKPYGSGSASTTPQKSKYIGPRWPQSLNPGKGKKILIFSGPRSNLLVLGVFRVHPLGKQRRTEMLLYQFAMLL